MLLRKIKNWEHLKNEIEWIIQDILNYIHSNQDQYGNTTLSVIGMKIYIEDGSQKIG